MAKCMTFRHKLVELLASHSEEREDLFTRLTADEQQAFVYQCYRVPTIGRIAPNSIEGPPFSDPDMRRLLRSAAEKVSLWVVDRLMADKPVSIADSH